MPPPPALKIEYHQGFARSKSIKDIVLLMSEREEREHNSVTVIRCATTPETTRNGFAGQAWHPSAADPKIHLTLEFSDGYNIWKRHVNREQYQHMKYEDRQRAQLFEHKHVEETTDTQRRQKIKNLIRTIARKLDVFSDANLDFSEEAILLREVREMTAHFRELEEVLEENEMVSSEQEGCEDEGFFEMDSREDIAF